MAIEVVLDKRRIVAYRNGGLSFKEVGQPAGQKEATLCGYIIARCRRKQWPDGADHTLYIVSLPVKIGGL
ncbi:hypothetical protein TNCV_3087631 [Trichonephila clavipes]|uniref:Uncharacterized protein n=1 Tax=Trichonephila clavipes TaxID=2585209 RepID=A0A8X6RL15_TRICX|nr:hypothetical protein TNCV_3087631 [Trichonephila clavipes]